ncbi:MAG: hypothetical protein PQJ46_09855 [Spirochaetales bacterium]|nr:hypothetical protein [Spirochaetales bacterium]
MKKKSKSKSISLLGISLAILFVTVGLAGITHYNSDGAEFMRNVNSAFGRNNDIMPIVMSVIEVAAGIVIVLNVFSLISGKVMDVMMLVILVYWIFKIVLAFFVNDFIEPDVLTWLGQLAPNLVVLAALWTAFKGKIV